jgi:hypothetical protein
MKTLLASILALSVLGTTAAAADPSIGVRIGPVGVGVGHYYWHHHYWHHRHWDRDHWRYW